MILFIFSRNQVGNPRVPLWEQNQRKSYLLKIKAVTSYPCLSDERQTRIVQYPALHNPPAQFMRSPVPKVSLVSIISHHPNDGYDSPYQALLQRAVEKSCAFRKP